MSVWSWEESEMRRTAIGICLWSLAGLLLWSGSAVRADGDAVPQGDELQEPVTLSVKDMDIKDVLSMFSDSRDLNIVCEGAVKGAVSIDLHGVPFPQALRAVVGMAGFDVTRKGNIYFVHKPAGGDPGRTVMLESRTFRLNYADPTEVQTVLGEFSSPIGKVTTYAPLRALVVEDHAEVLARMEAILAEIDCAPRQVIIEARLIEARLSDDMSMGIDWSLVFSQNKGSGNLDLSGFASPAGMGSEGFFITWGEGDFTAALEMMAGVEDLNTLAAPRLVAIDGAEAEIIIGGQLGFRVVTYVENTVMESVEFLDTGAQLRLTPTIAADGHILMSISPELSDGKIEEGLPSKTTTEVTTQVLVKDGQTLFIGGLIREREEMARQGIPLLMDIPLLGRLFGKTTVGTQKTEIVVLITPHIVLPGEAAPYEGLGLVDVEGLTKP